MGAGNHGGMGNTAGSKKTGGDKPANHIVKIAGSKKKKPDGDKTIEFSVTISGNAEEMKKDYPYTKNGKFGEKGKNAQIIKTDTPAKTSIDFYNRLRKGGKIEPLPNGKGTMTTLPDGTIITHRLVTKTPNSPAVDINVKHSQVIKSQKVHFVN